MAGGRHPPLVTPLTRPCTLCSTASSQEAQLQPLARSPSPYLAALESRLGAVEAGSLAADRGGRASALGQHRAATAARLQALIARAHHVATGGRSGTTRSSGSSSSSVAGQSSGSGGSSGGGAASRRSASALDHRRPAARPVTEQQRAASAMAMREQLHREAGAHAAGRGRAVQQRAPSVLGRHAPEPSAAPPAMAAAAAAGQRGTASRQLAPAAQPPSQLPTLQRPPSRLHNRCPSPSVSAAGDSPPAADVPSQARQALPPVRPSSAAHGSAKPPLIRSLSLCSGKSSMVGRAAAVAAADAAALFAATQAVRQLASAAEGEREAARLGQALAQAPAGSERQAAVEAAAGWLAAQLPAPAAALLQQLVAALLAGAGGGSGSSGAAPGSSSSPLLAGSQRPHQLFSQCNQLRGEKAALERLNADLSEQVRGLVGLWLGWAMSVLCSAG